MKIVKIVGILLLVYVALVVVFESLLGYFQPQAEGTVVITTFDADGTGHSRRVLTGLDSGERFYVAVNHWPRAWYRRALENPQVQLARNDETLPYLAVPVTGAEHERVASDHPIPLAVRFLMGFAPRHFLRLEPLARVEVAKESGLAVEARAPATD